MEAVAQIDTCWPLNAHANASPALLHCPTEVQATESLQANTGSIVLQRSAEVQMAQSLASQHQPGTVALHHRSTGRRIPASYNAFSSSIAGNLAWNSRDVTVCDTNIHATMMNNA
jgi:hypothetical protein